MHSCPICGMACDCDGEDTWMEAPDDCECWLACEEQGYADEEDVVRADIEGYEIDLPDPTLLERVLFALKLVVKPVQRCGICGKVIRVLWFDVGNHDGCYPF